MVISSVDCAWWRCWLPKPCWGCCGGMARAVPRVSALRVLLQESWHGYTLVGPGPFCREGAQGHSTQVLPWGSPYRGYPGRTAEGGMSRGVPGCLAQGCTGGVTGATANVGLGMLEHSAPESYLQLKWCEPRAFWDTLCLCQLGIMARAIVSADQGCPVCFARGARFTEAVGWLGPWTLFLFRLSISGEGTLVTWSEFQQLFCPVARS